MSNADKKERPKPPPVEFQYERYDRKNGDIRGNDKKDVIITDNKDRDNKNKK